MKDVIVTDPEKRFQIRCEATVAALCELFIGGVRPDGWSNEDVADYVGVMLQDSIRDRPNLKRMLKAGLVRTH